VLKGSFRTTLAGVGVILVAIGTAIGATFDNDPATVVNIPVLIAEVTAGLGLVVARDNKVSSEVAGAK
jgi:hypothetical protein